MPEREAMPEVKVVKLLAYIFLVVLRVFFKTSFFHLLIIANVISKYDCVKFINGNVSDWFYFIFFIYGLALALY